MYAPPMPVKLAFPVPADTLFRYIVTAPATQVTHTWDHVFSGIPEKRVFTSLMYD
jgi:hypothetical protein